MDNAMTYVDVDGHILEPSDMWKEYIEPEFRDRTVQILLDDKGLEYLGVDGATSWFMRGGVLGNIAGIGQDVSEHLTPGSITYEESLLPGGYDPHERIKVMDEEGIDVSILYPSLGLCWEDVCSDPRLAAANCRAYNNWMIDFCKPYPDRLHAAAHIPALDVEEGVKELRRVAGLGVRSAMLISAAPEGLAFGNARFDPLWTEAQELGIPISFHPTGSFTSIGNRFYPKPEDGSVWWIYVISSDEVKYQYTSLLGDGVLERFPELKVVLLESGVGWLPFWLERMDQKYEVNGFTTPMKMPPSEYFQRQTWIAIEPDESLAQFSIKTLGADKFFWAYDYPHSDSVTEPISKLNDTLAPLPDSTRRKIAGENAISLYDLQVGAPASQ